MNRFEGLVEFMAVIEAGSFSSAARKLGASVAHVSRHVAALERRMGTKLFNRTTRRVQATAAGEHLASKSLPLLKELAQIQHDVLVETESLEGQIRLSVGGQFVAQHVLPQLARFCTAYPRIQIEVELTNDKMEIFDGRFDFALSIAPLGNSTTLVARRIAEISMATLAGPALVARLENDIGTALSPLAIPKHLCLAFSGRPWRLYQNGQVCTIEPTGPISSSSPQVLAYAATVGLGVIHIPAFDVLETCCTRQLVPVFRDWHTEDSVVLNIVYARNRFMPSRVRLLIDYLVSCSVSEAEQAMALA